MYCAIRNFNEYNFNGNLDSIKEIIYNYGSFDTAEKLELTKDQEMVYTFKYYDLPSEDIEKEMSELCSVRPNIKIMFEGTGVLETSPDFPHFYDFSISADSLDMLQVLAETGVCDAYISGELGFKMTEVRKIADKYDISIRVAPNIASVSGFKTVVADNSTSFWIRPEDLDLYDGFIDIIEFMCQDDKQPVFFNIYFQEGKWYGNLSQIITGIHDIDSRYLSSAFGLNRFDCGKRCVVDGCHKCYKLIGLSEIALENKIDISKIEESL